MRHESTPLISRVILTEADMETIVKVATIPYNGIPRAINIYHGKCHGCITQFLSPTNCQQCGANTTTHEFSWSPDNFRSVDDSRHAGLADKVIAELDEIKRISETEEHQNKYAEYYV